MRRILIVIFVLLAIIVGYFLFTRQDKTPALNSSPVPTSKPQVESRFNAIVPENGDKTALRDVSGGNATGVVNRIVEGENITIFVYVDAPDPVTGSFYQAWYETNSSLKLLGTLVVGKGGWLLEKTVPASGSPKTIVVSEEKVLDQTPEKQVLRAEFSL